MASWMAKVRAPTPNAAGKVRIQATIMRPKTGQRTATPAPRPDPTTELVHTCVVESGNPRYEEVKIVVAEEVSAAKPCGDSRSVMPLPRVRMMRQPPMKVPRAMAMPQATMTQFGVVAVGARVLLAIRANVMIPMVFWASLVPCASAIMEAEPFWASRNPAVFGSSSTPLVILKASHVATVPRVPATAMAKIAGRRTLENTPFHCTASEPL